jgi:uncharacterized protein (TIGR03118 family)
MVNRQWRIGSVVSVAAAAAVALACLAGSARADQPFYVQTNLVSNNGVPGTFPDTNLVNAWGIVQPPGGPFWVNTNGTGFSELFDGTGTPLAMLPRVTIPPPLGGMPPSAPTGIVFNPNFMDLMNNFAGDIFIFATEDGTISGWQPPTTSAVLRKDFSPKAVYKGLAFGTTGGGAPMIYATNFREARIDVFDGNYTPVVLAPGDFTDPALPPHYAPFGIANIGGHLYVTYALQDAAMHDDVPGKHHGFIDEFTTDGIMVRRFTSRGKLNSPWGMALAPGNFGRFSGDLLVGNFRDGHINAFELGSGNREGELHGEHSPIIIDGLWSLAFGNGSTTFQTPSNTLFFSAGPHDENDGLFGKLEVLKEKHDNHEDGD